MKLNESEFLSMNAVWTVFKEHFQNVYLIKRLAEFQLRISNHSNYLGIAWELINPAMQIGILVCLWLRL